MGIPFGRSGVGALLLVGSCAVNCGVAVLVDLDPHRGPQLPDVGFNNLPYLPIPYANDCVQVIMLVASLGFFSAHPKGSHAFRRYCLLQSVLWIVRPMCFYATRMPNPYILCWEDEGLHTRPLVASLLRVWTGRLHTCNDIMFSGHASDYVLLGLAWHDHCSSLVARLIVWGLVGCGLVCLVVTRFHYTVDVYVGVMLAGLLYRVYHQEVALLALPPAGKRGVSAWVRRWVAWYEEAGGGGGGGGAVAEVMRRGGGNGEGAWVRGAEPKYSV